MAEYYVVELGPACAEEPYVSFRRPGYGNDVCWPLPWAGLWSEAAMVEAAAALNDGLTIVAVPSDAVHSLATQPAPGRIEGDVGPVVRNSASNRRALVLAARRAIARMEAVEIPPADGAARGHEHIRKALGALLPLLGREENIGNDHLWRIRAELLAALHSDDRRRDQPAVQAVHAIADGARTVGSEQRTPQRPVHPRPEPGQAQAAILRPLPPHVPPPPPSPDTEVSARVLGP